MSIPTILNPWYVVQTLQNTDALEYFSNNEDEGGDPFTEDPKLAMVFMSLNSAARVASSEGGHIRVLVTKEDAAEFGHS